MSKQRKLRRHASGGKFSPIQLSGADVTALEKKYRQEEIALEKSYKADIENRTQWLNQAQRARGITSQSEVTAKSFDDKHRQLELDAIHQKGKTEVQIANTEAKNAQKRRQDLINFVQNSLQAARAIKGAVEAKYQAEFAAGQAEVQQEQLIQASTSFQEVVDNGVPASDINNVKTIEGAAKVEQQKQNNQLDVQIAKYPQFFKPEIAHKLRNNIDLYWREQGRVQAKLTAAAKKYTDSMVAAAMDPEINQISIGKRPDGSDITLSDHNGAEEYKRLITHPEIVSKAFLEKFELTADILKWNAALTPAFYDSIASQQSRLFGQKAQADIAGQSNAIRNDALNQIRSSPDSETIHYNIRRLRNTLDPNDKTGKAVLGKVGARLFIENELFTAKTEDGLRFLYSNKVIEDYLNSSFPDQPDKKIGYGASPEEGGRYGDYSEQWAERSKEQSRMLQEQITRNKIEDKNFKKWVQGWIMEDPKERARPENLQALLNKEEIKSGAWSESAKYLGTLIETGATGLHNEAWLGREYKAKFEVGALTQAMVLEDYAKGGMSETFKKQWLDKAEQIKGAAPPEDMFKLASKRMKSILDGRLKAERLGEGPAQDTVYAAEEDANLQYKKDFVNCMMSPTGNANACNKEALGLFKDEFKLGEQGLGRYRLKTTETVTKPGSKGMVQTIGTGYYEEFYIKPVKRKDHNFTETRRILNESKDLAATIDSEELISLKKAESLRDAFKKGDDINIAASMPEAVLISNATGGKLSPLDVINRQLVEVYGVEGIEIEALRRIEQSIDPEYLFLLNYKPGNTRTTIAMRYSNIGAIRDENNFNLDLKGIITPETGVGYTIQGGLTDKEGDPIVLSPDTWTAYNTITYIAGGALNNKDITTSQQAVLNAGPSSDPNTAFSYPIAGAEHAGEVIGITGDSLEWIKANKNLIEKRGFKFIGQEGEVGKIQFIPQAGGDQ